jgi:hypothetical protein
MSLPESSATREIFPESIVSALKRDGMVLVPRGLDESGLHAARELSSALNVSSLAELRDRLAPDLLALPNGRGPRRWEFRVTPSGPWMDILRGTGGWLETTLSTYFGGPAWIAGVGVVSSFPGAPFGYPHRDGRYETRNLVSLFIPLQSLSPEAGPTEYWLQSNNLSRSAAWRTLSPTRILSRALRRLSLYLKRQLPVQLILPDLFGVPTDIKSLSGLQTVLKGIALRSRCMAQDLERVPAASSLGDVFLADYWTVHRGGANRSQRVRNIFYVVFGPDPDREEPNIKGMQPIPLREQLL